MTDITLAVNDGRVTTTSRQIATHFEKRHTDVLRAIAKLECSEEFSRRNFASAHYLDEQGKPRQEYTLTRDGFVFLCMGFTGKEAAQWKEKYIAAFNAMESKLLRTLPAPSAKYDAATMERINKRCRELAHRAYETYRDWMLECHFIERNLIPIENWLPPPLSDQVIDQIDTIAKVCETYAKEIRADAARLKQMAGSRAIA